MDETKLRTIAQLQEFLDATPEVRFTGAAGEDYTQRYEHISRVLKRFDYPRRKKSERGVVLAYLRRTSGYSRPQITRLVARWDENLLATVPLAKRYRAPAAPFASKYTASDIELLVQMDRANEDVCGPAIVHLLKRAHGVYGDARYERLTGLSVSHLYKLRIEQTKSRSRHSNDNALAESKNASVVRKHMGYSHIPQKYAKPINAFYEGVFNSWLNLHRPCLFATEVAIEKGKIIKRYKHKDVKTPLECLVLLNEKDLVKFKAGITLEDLLAKAGEKTDLQAAQEMQKAKAELFELFNKPKLKQQA